MVVMSHNKDFNYLLQGYIAQTLSDEEKTLLIEALSEPENVNKLSAMVAGIYEQAGEKSGFVHNEEKVEKMIRSIVNTSGLKAHVGLSGQMADPAVVVPLENNNDPAEISGKVRRVGRSWLPYAAAVVVLIGAAFVYFSNSGNIPLVPPDQKQSAEIDTQNDVLPGANKAVLTLSNGKTIELADEGRQVIQDGETAIQNTNGALEYAKSDLVALNTMSTPRGGQYKLKLADGTLVWLNASSSITYPTAFPGNARVVSITGEAYFEVAKDPSKPFTVKTYKDEITVKGTSFNVNSYTDEPGIKTSLLEGLVEINHTYLHPGNAYTDGKIVAADLGKELAWKNGVFNFHHVKLTDAMRQIARWYDVEIQYDKRVEDIELGGEIGRNLTLKQLLNGLEDKDLHFRLEGKVLTVY